MYRVQFKPSNAGQAWMGHGTYGSEAAAMQAADRIANKHFAVRVVDRDGRVVWVR